MRKRRWEEANGGKENVPFKSSIEQPPEEKGCFQFVSKEAVEKAACGVVPKNTERNNKWAVNTFESWRFERNKNFPVDKQFPSNILPSGDCEVIA